jgi:alpha-beta hydrolase superfamily lysophospholipase
VKAKEFKIEMRDGCNLYTYKWEPEEGMKVLGAVQIVHGSCEHSKRYIDFARYLTDNGFVVYSSDLRGHGFSTANKEDLGYFADEEGWHKVVEDLYEITKYIKKENPNVRLIMLGHSMGSFLARHYAVVHGKELDGLIATGTAHNGKLLLKFGSLLAGASIKKSGGKHRNHMLNSMSYDSFSKQFKPARTKQDWLSRDKRVVDEYIKDDLCGFVFTNAAFKDMFEGLLYITDRGKIRRTPKNLPILLLSGDRDPVGGNGKMVVKAYEEYKASGVEDVQMKLYKDMRHEILNEINKESVYMDIVAWLSNIVKSTR